MKYALILLLAVFFAETKAQRNYSVHDSIQNHEIQSLKLKFQKSKTVFKASGAALATGGALMLFNASAKQPDANSENYVQDMQQYNSNQKITKQVMSGCYIVAGICLIWGISISF